MERNAGMVRGRLVAVARPCALLACAIVTAWAVAASAGEGVAMRTYGAWKAQELPLKWHGAMMFCGSRHLVSTSGTLT
jgi:hypothetical protein